MFKDLNWITFQNNFVMQSFCLNIINHILVRNTCQRIWRFAKLIKETVYLTSLCTILSHFFKVITWWSCSTDGLLWVVTLLTEWYNPTCSECLSLRPRSRSQLRLRSCYTLLLRHRRHQTWSLHFKQIYLNKIEKYYLKATVFSSIFPL